MDIHCHESMIFYRTEERLVGHTLIESKKVLKFSSEENFINEECETNGEKKNKLNQFNPDEKTNNDFKISLINGRNLSKSSLLETEL